MSNSKKIRRLDVAYSINGHRYKLHLRSQNVASYKQYTKEGQLVGIEVFEIPTRPEETIGDIKYPLRETYPSNSSWGVSAFTLRFNSTDEKVKEAMDKLQRRYDEKAPLKTKTA